MIEHHVEPEEGKIFKHARESMSADELMRLDKEFESVPHK